MDVQGRVDITRTFDGRELNTEYLFGLFANLATSPAFSLLGVPISYEITHFAASQNIAVASTRYTSLSFHRFIPRPFIATDLMSFCVQLHFQLPSSQSHPVHSNPNLECFQRCWGDFDVRRELRGLVAMGSGHAIGSGTRAIVPKVGDKRYNGSDRCVCSIEVGYKHLHYGPRILRRTGTATV